MPSLQITGPVLSSARIRDDRIFFWWIILLIIARLWLLESQDFLATYTPHDDYLFVKLAKHILSGEWLGPYNQVTLVKGPVYPLFIAMAHHTGLPLLLFQHLLYSMFCILAIVAIRPLLKSRWLFMVIFFFFLFNPFTYLYPAAGRAFRLGLSMPLVLALFSCMLGLLLRANCSIRCKFLWATGTGLTFSLLWYTREEGIWLLPPLGLFALYFLVLNNELTWKNVAKRFLLLLWMGVIFIGFKSTFTSLNLKHYGAPHIIEIKSPEFQSALGGLMNIKVKETERYAPVRGTNQKAAYKVSPTYRQLRPYFQEGAKGARMPKSFFIWVLRDMVRKSGNADSLPEALAFYGKVGEEINTACQAGDIPCHDRKPSITPIWKADYIKFIPSTFWKIFRQAITFSFYNSDDQEYVTWTTNAKTEMVKDYQFVTREKLAPGLKRTIQAYPEYYMHMIIEKFRLLNDIAAGYKALVPYLFSLALLWHIIIIVQGCIQKTIRVEVVSGFIVLGGIVSLISVLTYVKITLWPVNRPLFSVYPLVLLYISMMSIFFCKKLIKTNVPSHAEIS